MLSDLLKAAQQADSRDGTKTQVFYLHIYLTLNLELCCLTNHRKIHESRRAANILKCTGNLESREHS